jgi:coproporphyrinogen III oxidase
MRIRMATWVTNMQDHIVKGLESLEAAAPPTESTPRDVL